MLLHWELLAWSTFILQDSGYTLVCMCTMELIFAMHCLGAEWSVAVAASHRIETFD